ncbi:hypothetical protein ACP70R_036105 [Stipagrostis hirtigluma subsp. patula]
MPAGSYLTMSRSRFSYHRLEKLPPPPAATSAALHQEQDHHHHHQQQLPESSASIHGYYSYYRALGAAAARGRRASGGRRRRRPRLRVSGLARALRRKAAAVVGKMRASAARVARRLVEGRPYVGDLFAGNYMFMQVAPSPTMAGLDDSRGFPPFAEYYAKLKNRPAAAGALQLRTAAAGALYRV